MNQTGIVAAVVAVSLLGCDNGQQPTSPAPAGKVMPASNGSIASSSKQRLTTSAPASDLTKVVSGQNEFAFAMLRELARNNSENSFFSPYSIATALSMTYPGARNATALAFEKTLNISIPQAQYLRAMNDLDRQLTSRGKGAMSADGKAFRLTTANQTFAQEGFAIEPPFLDVLAQEFGANVRLLDFAKQKEPSRLDINSWVASKTEDRIKELLKENDIQNTTLMVLVNAIYFNAAWAVPFSKYDTINRDFTLLDGSKVMLPTMMSSKLSMKAALVGGVEIVQLPYDGKELSMLVMMPTVGGFQSFEASLSETKLNAYVQSLALEDIVLSLPKFKVEERIVLKDVLQALGLGVALSDAADFSGITPKVPLKIDKVIHSAFVNVDENGTEAAAATAIVMGDAGSSFNPVPPRVVEINRPFVFAIYDNATGAIVFLGRIVKPG